MKRSLFILLAGATLAACGAKPEAVIEGTANGVADGTKIYLLDSAQARVDSTAVVGGAFRFEIATARPDRAALALEGRREAFGLFVEPGTITAAIDVAASPTTATFSGTPSNDARNGYEQAMSRFNGFLEPLTSQLNAATQGTPGFDSLMALYETFVGERNRASGEFLRANGATVFAASQLWSGAHAQTTPEQIDSLLAIVAGAPDNAFTDRLRERRELLATTAVGAVAPDFTQAQPDGTPLSLSQLRGKLVLIDFWASWCGPCRRENPNVVRMYNRFKDNGFEILGVSLDSDRGEWLKAIEDDALTWKHVSDLGYWNNAVAVQYAVRSIPHTVLVGPDGTIIAKNLRGAALEERVAQELGRNAGGE